MLPRHARCVLSRLCCNKHRLILNSYISGIGRIKLLRIARVVMLSKTPLILFCTVMLQTFCSTRSLATPFLSMTSGPVFWELPGFLDSMVSRHESILQKKSDNNNNITRILLTW